MTETECISMMTRVEGEWILYEKRLWNDKMAAMAQKVTHKTQEASASETHLPSQVR